MILKDLIHQFILIRKRKPAHANELLHYLQEIYSGGELSIIEYMNLLHELYKRGAARIETPLFENA
ncbi:MAG: YppF family protein [Ectobacillus sp.]